MARLVFLLCAASVHADLSLERFAWPEGIDGLGEEEKWWQQLLWNRYEPCLLEASLNRKEAWLAMATNFANVQPELDNALALKPELPIAYFYAASAVAAKITKAKFDGPHTWRTVKTESIFNNETLWYASTALELLDSRLSAELRRHLPEYITDVSRAAFWFASSGIIAQMHFDASPNIILVLSGTKRLRLIPPSEWRQLNLFPALHPGARQSSLLDAELNCTHPCIQLDLTPGQAIVLPAFYFHRVETVSQEAAISINAYFPNPTKDVAAEFAYRADIPIHRSDGLACALFRFLESVRVEDPPAFLRDLFISRWQGISSHYRFFRHPAALISTKSTISEERFSTDCEPLDDALRFDLDELLESIVQADLEPALPILIADRIEFALFRALDNDFTKIYPTLYAIVASYFPDFSLSDVKKGEHHDRHEYGQRSPEEL